MPQGYRRIDPFTVVDEFGVPHFMPEQYPLGAAPPDASNPGDMTRSSSAPGQVAQLMGPGNTNQGPGPAAPGDLQGMPQPNLVGPAGDAVDTTLEAYRSGARVNPVANQPFPDRTAPVQLPAQGPGASEPLGTPYPEESKKQRARRQKLEAIQQRQGALQDPGMFTAQGGVVQNREEMARLGGAAIMDQGAADASAVLGAREVGDAEAARDLAESRFHEDSAAEFHRISTEEHDRSVQRWEDWRRKNEQAANSKVDPHRMWNNASGFSKAMWVISLLSSGATGDPQKMQLALGVLDREIDRDISAQETDIKNKRAGVAADADAIVKLDSLGRLTLDDWATERNLRYQSLLKGLDSKIKQVGNAAAERTGLLQARATVAGKAADLQLKFQGQIQQEGAAAVERKFQAGMQSARFRHDKEMAIIDLKAGMERDAAKAELEKGGPGPGVDPSLGMTVLGPDGQPARIVAQGGTPAQIGENAQKIAAIATSGNQRYSALLTIEEELQTMTTGDLLRGGSAEFKRSLEEVATEIARDRGGPITESDRQAALKQVTGITVDSSILKNGWETVKLPGNALDAARNVVKQNIRDLPQRTIDRAKAVRGDQPGELRYVPKDIRGRAPVDPSNNDTLATLGRGADVQDLQTPVRTATPADTLSERRQGSGPNAGQYTNPAAPFDLDDAETRKAIESYFEAQEKGQPSPLPPEERAHVESAIEAFKGMSPQAIKARATAAIRGADESGMSDEAKLEIQAEAMVAAARQIGPELRARQSATAVKAWGELFDVDPDRLNDMIKTARTRFGVDDPTEP